MKRLVRFSQAVAFATSRRAKQLIASKSGIYRRIRKRFRHDPNVNI
jgi:hypothetical protein